MEFPKTAGDGQKTTMTPTTPHFLSGYNRHCWRKYRAVFDACGDAILLVGLDGHVFECNPAACSLYGYTMNEILTRQLSDLIPEQLAATMPEIIAEDTTTKGDFVWRSLRNKDGTIFPARISTQIIRVEKRKCLLVCVRKLFIRKESWLDEATDVTQSKDRDIPVYTITWQSINDDFVMIGCNMSTEDFTDKPITDCIGKKASELYSTRPDILEDLWRCYEEETVFKKNIPYLMFTTGKERRMSATYVYMTPNLILVYLRDITEREQALSALQESEQRLRTQYLYMPVPTFTWQRKEDEFLLMDFNLAAEEYTHGQICEYIGSTAGDIYADQPDILDDFKRCFDEKTHVKREMFYTMFTTGQKKIITMTCTYIPPDLVMCHMDDITKSKLAEKELRSSERNLKILSSQLMNAEEKVRKRIALELHDSIGQCLSTIKFNAENTLHRMMNVGVRESLESLKAGIPIIQRAIEEVRKISMELRPPILDDLGIVATISWFCREFKEIYADIRVERQITIKEEDIPDHLKIILFRILQEALNNAAKHSKADHVLICLSKNHRGIRLSLRDNGTGFDMGQVLAKDELSRGMGLASMRERVEITGGVFSIETGQGRSTTVLAVWPQ